MKLTDKGFLRVLCGAVLVMVASPWAAAPIEAATLRTVQFTVAAPLHAERWNATLSVPQFDPHQGTLRQVTLRLTGHVEGSSRFENLDGHAVAVTQTLSALLDLRTPANGSLLQALPLRRTDDEAASYDGSTDYAGASGRTHTGLSSDHVVELQIVSVPELRLFTGTGSLALALLSRPNCGGTGSGIFTQFFTTRSGATLTVIYTYESAPVPVRSLTWSGLKLLRP